DPGERRGEAQHARRGERDADRLRRRGSEACEPERAEHDDELQGVEEVEPPAALRMDVRIGEPEYHESEEDQPQPRPEALYEELSGVVVERGGAKHGTSVRRRRGGAAVRWGGGSCRSDSRAGSAMLARAPDARSLLAAPPRPAHARGPALPGPGLRGERERPPSHHRLPAPRRRAPLP